MRPSICTSPLCREHNRCTWKQARHTFRFPCYLSMQSHAQFGRAAWLPLGTWVPCRQFVLEALGVGYFFNFMTPYLPRNPLLILEALGVGYFF